jgi:hypothetical protein
MLLTLREVFLLPGWGFGSTIRAVEIGRYATIVLVWACLAAGAAALVQHDFARYEVILQRKPFGFVPEPVRPKIDPVGKIPRRPEESFAKYYKLCAIMDGAGGIRVGIVSIRQKPPKSYFIRIGETIDEDIELVDADFETESALLRRDSEEHWLSLSGGLPGSGAAGAGATRQRAAETLARNSGYADRMRRRKAVVNRIRRQPPKLTGKALYDGYRKLQMQQIRKGMPTLPIPLTKEMDDQLVSEGVLAPQNAEQDALLDQGWDGSPASEALYGEDVFGQ